MTIESELAHRLERGEAVVLATVIRLDGEPPSEAGSKVLMSRDGILAGTLGCSEFDAAARADSPALLQSGRPEVRTYKHDLGSIEVYLEPHQAPARLVVLGETPVARQLAKWAEDVGFRAGEPPASGDLYVVHTDHEAADLADRIEALIAAKPRFVGIMGSRRHVGHHLDELRRRGVDPTSIDAIQTPVGLDIGAMTAEEIALSILAGLVAVRHGRAGGFKSAAAP